MTIYYRFNFQGLRQSPPQGGGERMSAWRLCKMAEVLGFQRLCTYGSTPLETMTANWLRSQGHAVTEIQTENPAKP